MFDQIKKGISNLHIYFKNKKIVYELIATVDPIEYI